MQIERLRQSVAEEGPVTLNLGATHLQQFRGRQPV